MGRSRSSLGRAVASASRSHRHRRERRRGARRGRAARRPVPRHVGARQADRSRGCAATRSPAASGSRARATSIVAADDAVFGTPEINVGLWPYMITVPLLRSMPPKTVLELMMTGRRVVGRGGRAHRLRAARRAGRRARRGRRRARGRRSRRSRRSSCAGAATRFYRVLEMDADAALVVPPGHAHGHDADRGRGRGRRRVRREARAAMEGTVMASRCAGRRRARLGAARRRPRGSARRARSRWAAPKRVERQRSLGKLTVRERLDLLLDPGTWVEYGLLADHMDAGPRRPVPRGRRRGHRRRRDRRPAGRGRGLRLHA